MKNKITVLAIMVGLLALVSGCALYKSERQYDQGEWKGWAGGEEVARTKQDKLALAKLQATPVQTLVTNGVSQGYLGVIANMSTYRRLLFKYIGPETGIEYLGPGQQIEKYLLPGQYQGEIFYGGEKVGWLTFKSEPVVKTFFGRQVHWMFFSEW
ncbi:MAG: hypothetical protein UU95_C0024G0018 [Parcubacteria group bacterium GW2011_GWC2_42_12]|uniref:Lipoprotein n=1 Tax=Candidatus Falkowbacteria bacterium GW2011_GWA2_41_14 TaxID=1618635 RepID=A0A0G0UT78_9BACT|nr:MAG: hypothetical protein UU43_C0001G0113 [Candidatus Falkowbacteria bacterium GW2011_GWA2_41_14]KKS33711.1 MAG: hypothetical protein UU95_C0024G0018 [Parcubacteria group bacterium GW2011_GWC2_42_12]